MMFQPVNTAFFSQAVLFSSEFPVVYHVWEMLMTTSELGNPFTNIDDLSKLETPVRLDLLHTWKMSQAGKALQDFSVFFARTANLNNLKYYLRNSTTTEHYKQLILPLIEYDEQVQEERVECVCERVKAREVLAAIRKVHPYEEVAFDIYPLILEEEL
jgi:hypothetical protein